MKARQSLVSRACPKNRAGKVAQQFRKHTELAEDPRLVPLPHTPHITPTPLS